MDEADLREEGMTTLSETEAGSVPVGGQLEGVDCTGAACMCMGVAGAEEATMDS